LLLFTIFKGAEDRGARHFVNSAILEFREVGAELGNVLFCYWLAVVNRPQNPERNRCPL
jgi:hypothetical protein